MLPMILARAPLEDEKVKDSTFTVTLATSVLAGMTIIMYAYILPNMYKQMQRMRRIPRTGINFPVPQRWRNLEVSKLGKEVVHKDTSMDKNSSSLLSHYGDKLSELDDDAEKRLAQKMAELEKQLADGGGLEDDFEYKKRIMELASLQEQHRKQKSSTYIFEGVDVEKKLKDAEEEIARADKVLKEHAELAAEMEY